MRYNEESWGKLKDGVNVGNNFIRRKRKGVSFQIKVLTKIQNGTQRINPNPTAVLG